MNAPLPRKLQALLEIIPLEGNGLLVPWFKIHIHLSCPVSYPSRYRHGQFQVQFKTIFRIQRDFMFHFLQQYRICIQDNFNGIAPMIFNLTGNRSSANRHLISFQQFIRYPKIIISTAHFGNLFIFYRWRFFFGLRKVFIILFLIIRHR